MFLSVIVFSGAAFLVPKQISRLEMYATCMFCVFLEYITNYTFDFVLKIYGYFNPGVDILTFVAVIGIFPAINILFLNLYPYKERLLKKIGYVIGWSLFSLFYEVLSLKSKYFYYSGWSLWMSAIAYPILFTILLLNLKLVRKLIRKEF